VPIKATRKRVEYAIPPEGVYIAVLADVTEPVEQPDKFNPGETKETVTLHWLLEEFNPKTDRPFEMQYKCTLSMFAGKGGSGGSNLYKLVKSMTGTALTQEEADDFDLESLLGASCQLSVVHVTMDDGRTFGNVGGVFPLKAGMSSIKIPEDYVRRKDRTP